MSSSNVILILLEGDGVVPVKGGSRSFTSFTCSMHPIVSFYQPVTTEIDSRLSCIGTASRRAAVGRNDSFTHLNTSAATNSDDDALQTLAPRWVAKR